MNNKLYVDSFVYNNYTFYLGVNNDKLVCFDVLDDFNKKNNYVLVKNSLVTEKYKKEILKYFNKESRKLTIEIELTGTKFQKEVWNELLKIPYGETRTYSYIAEKLGDIKKTRAVANAISKNNILIIVPCHRVIGKNKTLTGFSSGLDLKEYLLQLEGFTNYIK